MGKIRWLEVLSKHTYRYGMRSLGSVVSIATRVWTVGSVFERGKKFFFSPKRPQRHWGPPKFLFIAYRVSFSGVERTERLVDRHPASNAEVKNDWSHISTPSIRLHGVDWDNFTFVHSAQNENDAMPLLLSLETLNSEQLLDSVSKAKQTRSSLHRTAN